MPRKKSHLLDFLDWETYKILSALNKEPLSFTELQKVSSLAKPNFDARLKALLSLGVVEEILVEIPDSKHKKKKYTLTDFGKYVFRRLEDILKEAKSKGLVAVA
jgi:DNA-binding HxlR family transcriptional regulator